MPRALYILRHQWASRLDSHVSLANMTHPLKQTVFPVQLHLFIPS